MASLFAAMAKGLGPVSPDAHWDKPENELKNLAECEQALEKWFQNDELAARGEPYVILWVGKTMSRNVAAYVYDPRTKTIATYWVLLKPEDRQLWCDEHGAQERGQLMIQQFTELEEAVYGLERSRSDPTQYRLAAFETFSSALDEEREMWMTLQIQQADLSAGEPERAAFVGPINGKECMISHAYIQQSRGETWGVDYISIYGLPMDGSAPVAAAARGPPTAPSAGAGSGGAGEEEEDPSNPTSTVQTKNTRVAAEDGLEREMVPVGYRL